MSRIGKQLISLPKEIEFRNLENNISIKGPKGQIMKILPKSIEIEELEPGVLSVKRSEESRKSRQLHGLFRSLLSNMVVGVTQGFTKTLDMKGVGYKAALDKGTLVLNVGFSHPVRIPAPTGIKFEIETNTIIRVIGVDKEVVGLVAQKIRSIRPPEPYKGKGIMYRGEVIQRKAGKSSK
uniref:Large ribosomal subunit protein uL6c n=1 Tax=Eustigmatophyceae sp. Ndem 8/9T-3m6.8 TaxID=2506146 RepID=A0A410D267_9STRA|nr:ribosomal protein L6 [Eustigmatophyceae sp. Ndem 8/9T-3m6.8]QAA11806.1 ribosomal protein L6 [Eustigmatophyceae sp. Ndem 8/9T-3m6.8]